MTERHLGSTFQARQTGGFGKRLRNQAGDHLVERAVALACLLILAVGCYLVMQPVLSSLLWSLILTISTWPLHRWLTRALGGRKRSSAAILTVITTALFVVPLVLLGHNLAENVAELAAKVADWRNNGVSAASVLGGARCRWPAPGFTNSGRSFPQAAWKLTAGALCPDGARPHPEPSAP